MVARRISYRWRVTSLAGLMTMAGFLMNLSLSGVLTSPSSVQAQTCQGSNPDEWDGGGGLSSDKKWTNDVNWLDNSQPGGGNGCLKLPSGQGWTTCEFNYDDENPEGWVGVVTVFGSSPTVFTLHISDKQFRPSQIYLFDYARLKVDLCTEVRTNSVLEANSEIIVASGVGCCLNDTEANAHPTVLKLTGVADIDFLTINAQGDGADRSFRLKGGGSLDVNRIFMDSGYVPTDPAVIAVLTVEAGTLTTNELNLHAGQTNARRIGIDVADPFTVKNKTTIDGDLGGGLIVINVEPGEVIDLGELIATGPAVIKVTGDDSTPTPGLVKSSYTEGVTDETCVCPGS